MKLHIKESNYRIEWEPVLESEDDDGNITIYSTTIDGINFWISANYDSGWQIESEFDDEILCIDNICGKAIKSKGFKSFNAAKNYFQAHLNDILNIIKYPDDLDDDLDESLKNL